MRIFAQRPGAGLGALTVGPGTPYCIAPRPPMIRTPHATRAFLRALACHAAPMAWATNVATSRLENASAEAWVLVLGGRGGAARPVGEIRVMAAGTARSLAALTRAGDAYEIGPGQAVELEITPEEDCTGLGFSLRRAGEGPFHGCRFQVAQAGVAARPVFEVTAPCAAVRLDPARVGDPQDGPWIRIGPPGH